MKEEQEKAAKELKEKEEALKAEQEPKPEENKEGEANGI